MDVLICCDRGPPAVYDCQRDESTALTDAELKHLWWNIDCLRPESLSDAMRAYHSLRNRLVVGDDENAHGHWRADHRKNNNDWSTYGPDADD